MWQEKHFARLVDKLIEEMAELTKELMKHRQSAWEITQNGGQYVDRVPAIEKEISDVLICLEFIGRHFGIHTETMRLRVSNLAFDLDVRLGAFEAAQRRAGERA